MISDPNALDLINRLLDYRPGTRPISIDNQRQTYYCSKSFTTPIREVNRSGIGRSQFVKDMFYFICLINMLQLII